MVFINYNQSKLWLAFVNKYQIKKIHWPSGTTLGSNSSLSLFYSICLGPEKKILEETPWPRKNFFFLWGRKETSAILFFVASKPGRLSNHLVGGA